MGFIEGFMDGWNGIEGHRYSAGGIRVKCAQCGNDLFDKSKAQLNTAGMTFLGLDQFNRTGTALICAKCGHIEWFAKPVERMD